MIIIKISPLLQRSRILPRYNSSQQSKNYKTYKISKPSSLLNRTEDLLQYFVVILTRPPRCSFTPSHHWVRLAPSVLLATAGTKLVGACSLFFHPNEKVYITFTTLWAFFSIWTLQSHACAHCS